MSSILLTCDRCKAPLALPRRPDAPTVPCLHCGTPTRVVLLPAFFRPPPLPDAGAAAMPSESTCFFHAGKKAVVPCDGCGRFLCALCDVEWNGRHFCMGCLEKAHKGAEPGVSQGRRMLYDSLALSISVIPLLFLMPFFFITLFTAPVGFYFAVKALRQPRGPVPGRRIRAVFALLFSLLQIGGWTVFGVIAINRLLT